MPVQEAPDDFEAHRRYLIGIAYRMLGSVAEAEDAVQDAYLRWHGTARETVDNPRAFLSTVVTRLCLDRLKSAQRRREIYVGPWLPEPMVDDLSLSVAPPETVGEDISVALMLALERLSPLERAAFILHDVFDMEFAAIAAALDRSEAACRQLASRARLHVQTARPRFKVSSDESERVSDAFFGAVKSGDVGGLRDLLTATATLRTDGGGRKLAARNVISGAERIARFFAGTVRKWDASHPLWTRRLAINGMPGLATVESDGTLQTIAIEIADGRVGAVYVTRNPDKLRHVLKLVPEEIRPA